MRWWIGQDDEDDRCQTAFAHAVPQSLPARIPASQWLAVLLMVGVEAALWLTLAWIALCRIARWNP
jgi:hypothetical protein